MPCGTKLSSNKNAKSNLTLTPDNLDYINTFVCMSVYVLFFFPLFYIFFIVNGVYTFLFFLF